MAQERSRVPALAGALSYQVVVIGLLLVTLCYVALLSMPVLFDLRVLGMEGVWSDGRFLVERVLVDSPAAAAGLQPGDELLEQGGLTPTDWHRLFVRDRGTYLAERAAWQDYPVQHRVRRGGSELGVGIAARSLSLPGVLAFYAPRLALCLLLLVLGLFLSHSAPGEKPAFLCALCFCFVVLWLLSGVRYWSGFMAPYVSAVTMDQFIVIRVVSVFTLLMILGLLAHFSFLFPVDRTHFPGRRMALPGLYLLPHLMVLLILGLSEGSLSQRLTACYRPVPLLATLYLGLAAIRILASYYTCHSAGDRVRSRWVVVPMVAATGLSLVLWSLPKLLIGRPLVNSYDWLLLPFSLVPLGMTLAIDRHHLFGIPGIIRRRISLLRKRLEREQQRSQQKDETIQTLLREVEELQQELARTRPSRRAATVTTDGAAAERLQQLEERYPVLVKLREQRLVSDSPLWPRVLEAAVLAAQGTAPVLICGESGTGKTDLAWAVHQLGPRAGRVFREISCAQLEHSDPAFALGRLFGHGKGHGLPNVAREGQPGLLQECDGGTLLLDDVDRLPLHVQDLLLYPLEGKPFEPGTGSGPRSTVSIKFIFASNRDLDEMVSQGLFRGDVLARMTTRVAVPPLRDRPEDVPRLVERFVARASDELEHRISEIAPEVTDRLMDRPWSAGNVRELRSEIYQAVGRARLDNDPVLRSRHLAGADRGGDAETSSAAGIPVELQVLRRHGFQIKPASQALGLSDKARTLSNHLRGICIKALSESRWDVDAAAAEVAGSDDPDTIETVRRKIQRYLRHLESSLAQGPRVSSSRTCRSPTIRRSMRR